uniref:Uncharacterized protein n=1 Tax=Caenorhabditis angaria TaxID=860376 RepID=B6VBU3_9PELO|nr:hypothetical protein Csp3_JD02.014 [Caenorhabditis angaria]
MMRFLAFLVILIVVYTNFVESEDFGGYRSVRGDMSSVFFSPFRVGKRNQFYGLYKHIARDSPDN